MLDRILGALYGMALGDSMGMPSELLSRRRIREIFGKIKTFLGNFLRFWERFWDTFIAKSPKFGGLK